MRKIVFILILFSSLSVNIFGLTDTSLQKNRIYLSARTGFEGVGHAEFEDEEGRVHNGQVIKIRYPQSFGYYIGCNLNYHNIDIPANSGYTKWDINSNPTGTNFSFGLFYEYFFGHDKDLYARHSFVFRLLYNPFKADITNETAVDSSFLDFAQSLKTKAEQTIEIDYKTISFDILYKYNIFGGLVLTAGPSVDIPVKKQITHRIDLDNNGNELFKPLYNQKMSDNEILYYANNFKRIIVKDGEIKNVKNIRFALKGGIQYEISTPSHYDIIPSLFYNFGLGNLVSTKDWKLNSIQLGIDIRYYFF